MAKNTKKTYEKERYWTFILYEDSKPKDWKEYLQQTGLKIGLSPLHDKDLNVDGEEKKPHTHVLLCFEGPTTYSRVEKITNYLNGTIPQRVISPIGMIRYFTHKDNPEKYQYDDRDIISINGFDVLEFSGITISQELELKRALISLIQINNFEEYSELIDYLYKNELKDMFKIASEKTLFFNAYLKSRKWRSLPQENG